MINPAVLNAQTHAWLAQFDHRPVGPVEAAEIAQVLQWAATQLSTVQCRDAFEAAALRENQLDIARAIDIYQQMGRDTVRACEQRYLYALRAQQDVAMGMLQTEYQTASRAARALQPTPYYPPAGLPTPGGQGYSAAPGYAVSPGYTVPPGFTSLPPGYTVPYTSGYATAPAYAPGYPAPPADAAGYGGPPTIAPAYGALPPFGPGYAPPAAYGPGYMTPPPYGPGYTVSPYGPGYAPAPAYDPGYAMPPTFGAGYTTQAASSAAYIPAATYVMQTA